MLVDFLISVADFIFFLIKAMLTCAAILFVVVVVPLLALKNLKNDDKQANDPTEKLRFIDLKQLAKKRKKLIQSKLKSFNPDHKLEKEAKRLGLKKEQETENSSCACASKTTENAEQSTVVGESTTVENAEQTSTQHVVTDAEAKSENTEKSECLDKASSQENVVSNENLATEEKASETQSAEGECTSEVKPSVNSSCATDTNSTSKSTESSKCPFKCAVSKVSGLMQKKKANKDKSKAKFLDKKQERADDISALETAEKEGEFCPQNLYVIEFSGSTAAREVAALRLQIDAILDVATEKDEVILKLESPGGSVTGYGLCATQLSRIRNRGIQLTVVIDEVAASGGYMMACVANKIVSAPFAYIGSVGVVGTLPNVHNLAKRFGVDIEQHTAGKYKRTLTMVGENTEEGRQKFKEELTAVHNQFKAHIHKYRPALDIENVATGEAWLALDALKLGLIDEIAASDDYINSRIGKTYNSALKIEYSTENKGKFSALRKLLPKFKFKINVQGLNVDDLNHKLNELQDESFRNIR